MSKKTTNAVVPVESCTDVYCLPCVRNTLSDKYAIKLV